MYDIIEKFLVEVFGEDPIEDARLVLMTRGEGVKAAPHHEYFNDPIKAAEYADSVENRHVYFGISLFHPQHDSRAQDNTVGSACFGIDIDIKGDAHKRENLCPSKREAADFLLEAVPGCPPTIIIDSGHGIQGFFIFKEPFIFANSDDRTRAYATAHALHRTVAYHAKAKGWHVDSVFDLARVMRLPGTLNIKDPTDPKLVTILVNTGHKYGSPDDFDGLMVSDDDHAKARSTFSLAKTYYTSEMSLALHRDAVAPQEKLEMVLEVEPRFAAAWDRRRIPGKPKDEKEEDSSLSSMDMTLANYAVQYGWSNQEVANLLIHFRRRNMRDEKDLLKAVREDYIERTILKARQAFVEMQADKEKEKEWSETAKTITDAQNVGINVGKNDDLREKARKAISLYFGFEVERVLRYQGTPAEYSLIPREGKPIKIGRATTLTSQPLLTCAVMDQTSKMLPRKKQTAFHNMLTSLMSIIEDVETSEDTDDDSLLIRRIRDYWQSSTIAEDKNDGFKRRVPFIHDGKGYIFGEELRRHIRTADDERITAKALGMLMRQVGCTTDKMHFEVYDNRGKTVTNTSVYNVSKVIPPSWVVISKD
jgi:hypothetical protein